MWKIYDDLINTIPEDVLVLDCIVGLHWTLVKTERGTGTAMTVKGGKTGREFTDVVGMTINKVAAYVKSWNMVEASIGQAAMNAVLNTPANVSAITGKKFTESTDPEEANGFARFMPEIEGKNVAVVGHFPHIESLKSICQLSILERNPLEGDFPDPACEDVLPKQDVVFITGTAFINKTMPRLLDLSRNSRVILVGPSVPISPILFDYRVDTIASTVILDENRTWKTVKQGGRMNIFRNGGQMVCIQH